MNPFVPSTLHCSTAPTVRGSTQLLICPNTSRTPTSGHAQPHEGPTFLLLLQAELRGLVDVLACANFGPVLFVSLSYYTMRLLPIQEPIYGDDYRFQVLPAGVNPLENWVRLYLTCLPCLPFSLSLPCVPGSTSAGCWGH